MHWLDWSVVAAYVVFALVVGLVFARRAGSDVDQFFLSGRSLPWWVAGTSMVATTFAADTPLVVTGWVRDYGIWKNWLWWAFAANGMLTVFLFSRWWRRGGVMTKAELAELRYGGSGARILRAVLGTMHAGITNTIVLCWVLLAAVKILDVLLGVDKVTGIVVASLIALVYSLLAGFWGVVITDMVQFVMAIAGAVILAALAWGAIGGGAGLEAARAAGVFGPDTLRFLPRPGEGTVFDASFWTAPVAALAVYLGVSWWAAEGVDGSSTTVQRVSAARTPREGMLATLWYNVAHYALRPWPWILVAVASLVILPDVEVRTEHPGRIVELSPERVVVAATDGAGRQEIPIGGEGFEPDWTPLAAVRAGEVVEAGAVVARTDGERAYVVMMTRFLPAGLLGLVVASLLAAFMSTIDTHVNLASSFFVNDLYRRFVAPGRGAAHYVGVARLASVGVLSLGGLLAYAASSISGLFLFFLAFLGGVGPVYVARWLWWRVRASTEITAMLASAAATVTLTFAPIPWPDTPLSPAGALAPEGRLCLVVAFSMVCAACSMLVTRAPDPKTLVAFYRTIRPLGAWGPVRALAPDVQADQRLGAALVGAAGGLAATYGSLFGLGCAFIGLPTQAAAGLATALAGAFITARSLAGLREEA
ncbi:MAG: Na+:solute symporter [Planctomycetota bacterium]|jgi:Na+/proline symporter|nr:Na+:solute symporter [Planctomycetota bacterium]MDP6761237.1 Na+:solute symporter [Planctomycetota bacterium]MDP6988377.1 Na+:solute symporter [Planctomycetota bacterium]